tara:strand:- start:2108 stop:2368 length:261 start_codon:yes stop_codon:yes gene_type:complete
MLTTKSGAGLFSGVAPQFNEGSMMLISILKGFVFEGKDLLPGEQIEVPEKFAIQQIEMGRAVATVSGTEKFIDRINEAPKKSKSKK